MEFERNRIDWVDNLKFIGMFYIYIGHLGSSAGKLYPFVFTFHVPLFFFISGLFYRDCLSASDLKNVFIKSFKRIMVPYFIFSAIGISMYAIKSSLSPSQVLEMVINAIYGIRNHVPVTSLWFLPCLFIIIVYNSAIQLILRNRNFVLVISFLFYLSKPYWGESIPSFVFNMDSALYYLVFYSFGSILNVEKIEKFVRANSIKSSVCNIMILILSILLALYSYQYSAYSLLAYFSNDQVKYAIFFIITLMLFIPSIYLSLVLKIPAITYLGRNSLPLCGTEQMVKVMVPTFLITFGVRVNISDPLQAVLYTGFLFVISYFIIVPAYNSFKAFTPTSNLLRGHERL